MGLGDWEGKADFPDQGQEGQPGLLSPGWKCPGDNLGEGPLVWSLVWGPLSRSCSTSCFLEGPLSRGHFLP